MIINKVKTLVMQDCRNKIRKLADKAGITSGSVHFIMKDYLGFKRVSVKVTPKLLMTEQKLFRLEIAQGMLETVSSLALFSLENRQALHKISCISIVQVFLHFVKILSIKTQWRSHMHPCSLAPYHQFTTFVGGKKFTHVHQGHRHVCTKPCPSSIICLFMENQSHILLNASCITF